MQKAFSLYSFKKRILAVFLAISFLFCALCVRLFVIQIVNGNSLQARATDQWTRDLAITAPRGGIYDRTGSALAVSYTTYNVYVRPREVTQTSLSAQSLASVLDLPFEKVYQKITKKSVSEVLIKMQIEGEEAEKVYKLALPGVYLAENSNRYYPYGNLLTQVIGFTSVDNIGQTGVEAYYNKHLQGQDGCSYVQSDLQGKEIGGSLRYYIPATAGSDLTLSVDSKMQLIVERSLEQIMTEQKTKSVSGVLADINSGEILAVSTKPSFNLNEVPRDDLNALFEQSKLKVATDVYEPGSTFKILTVAMALEEGLTNMEDRFYCPGYRIIDGVRIKCWRTIGHGSQTLKEAFANSCNCCFMDLALRIGKDKFYAYLNKFGLGEKTGIDASGEAGGILMAKKLVKNVDLARMGFGHAVALTPLQLICAVSSIANGGNYNSLHLVKDGKAVKSKTGVVSMPTSQKVNQLLEFAENRTGKYTFVEGYNVGGKTGTAQKYKEGGGIAQGKYISSFIGTYPADNPQYILFIMVDEPSAGAYYGGVVAAPYGKQIFSQLFDYLNEQKQDESVVAEYTTMPFVEGRSLADAILLIKQAGLQYEIDGDGQYVSIQLPPAGTTLAKGTMVQICTE